jgi:hypothetical protein
MIRELCQDEGERIRRWLNRASEPVAQFLQTAGRAQQFGALLCLEYAGQSGAYWRSRPNAA